jgi:hypothetical protein
MMEVTIVSSVNDESNFILSSMNESNFDVSFKLAGVLSLLN